MASPNWLSASTGYVGYAGSINQFLGSHAAVFGYSGSVIQASGGSGDAIYQSTESTYWAQYFTTGVEQTVIGSVNLQISTVGGSPISNTISPLIVSLYASSAGTPVGSPIAQVTLTEEYVYAQPFWVSVPMGVTGLLPSTQYQLVVSPAGTATAYYVWQQADAFAGASSAPDGITWTEQNFGFMFQVYDNSGTTGNPLTIIEDNGSRVTNLTYNTNGQPITIAETTQAQNGVNLTQSRTLTYSGTQLIGIA